MKTALPPSEAHALNGSYRCRAKKNKAAPTSEGKGKGHKKTYKTSAAIPADMDTN